MEKIKLPEKLHPEDVYFNIKGSRNPKDFRNGKPVYEDDFDFKIFVNLPNGNFYDLKGNQLELSQNEIDNLHPAKEGFYNMPGFLFASYFLGQKDISFMGGNWSHYFAWCHVILNSSFENLGSRYYLIEYHRNDNMIDMLVHPWANKMIRKIDPSTLKEQKSELLYESKFLKTLQNNLFRFWKKFLKKYLKDCRKDFITSKRDLNLRIDNMKIDLEREEKYGYDTKDLKNKLKSYKQEKQDLIEKYAWVFDKTKNKKLEEVKKDSKINKQPKNVSVIDKLHDELLNKDENL